MTTRTRTQLTAALTDIYGAELAAQYLPRFTKLISESRIPPRDTSASQADMIVITYGDHIQSPGAVPLRTLHAFARRHLRGVVNTIHILPHYPYTCDDGFGVSDYRAVNPDLGTWADVRAIGRDFELMYDAVINHISCSHQWFQAFLRDDPVYRDFIATVPAGTDVSAVTRPRTHPLLTPYETPSGIKNVWTTFSPDQADLNYSNPAVLLEILDLLLFYARQGGDILRLDAVGFIWRELGTSCLNLPPAHRIVQLLRLALDEAAPWVRLVTETNVPHDENIAYFGDGTHDEAQMAYNFSLPPLVVHSLQTGDATVMTKWAATLSTPNDRTCFYNFTASHDGIGLRGATGLLSLAQIDTLCREVLERGGRLSSRTLPDGSTAVYEMNISFFNAVTRPADEPGLAVRKFICSQAIALSLAGVPGVYLHSLLGSTNWTEGVEKLGYNRAINRQKLDAATVKAELADPASRRAQIFSRYSQLLTIRAAEPAFHPHAPQLVLKLHPAVFAVRRTARDESSMILALHNTSANPVTVALPSGQWTSLMDQGVSTRQYKLAPYEVAWLKLTSD